VALRIMVAHSVAPVAALILALSGALLLSWLLHIAVEVPTHRLGQRWARAMTRIHPGLAQPGSTRM
jgi:peptidoglycan/LPS O-acetylase OafA/YrhL